jgi:general secretion pathway protein D
MLSPAHTNLLSFRHVSIAYLPSIGQVAGICVVLLLAGCASQSPFREGQNLTAKGNVEAGMSKFQEALKLEPDNIEFKTAYARSRERTILNRLEQADRQSRSGQALEAEQSYRRVLALDPANERARAGIEGLARDARHATLLQAAALDVEKKNSDLALQKLTLILRENPKNETARALLISLSKKLEAPAVVAESLLAESYKVPITLDFKEATLKQIFDVIAQTSGLNILFDKDVKLDQKASIILKKSTIEAAIYFVLLTNNLEQQVIDANTLLIYPNNADKQKTYQQVIVKTFLLSSAKASAVAETLKTLIKLHEVVVDDKLNMLIVRDTPEALRLAEKIIATQDIAEPEVMLEVEVLEVSRERLLELGVAWPGNLTLTPLTMATAATPLSSTGLTVTDLRGLNQSSLGAAIDPAKINARAVDTDSNILANPRIRVLNHEKAKILIGDRVPSISTTTVSSSVGNTTSEAVSYLDVGLKLDVEPTVYLDNDVAIRIGLEVSSIVNTQKSPAGTVYYTIGTRAANTMLRLKDGENQVLAGLINDQDQRSANNVPGLGDIPILGRLFGSTLRDGKKTEIVLSITPHIIRNIKPLNAGDSEFLSGTENSLRRRPDFTPRPVPAVAPAVSAITKGQTLPAIAATNASAVDQAGKN